MASSFVHRTCIVGRNPYLEEVKKWCKTMIVGSCMLCILQYTLIFQNTPCLMNYCYMDCRKIKHCTMITSNESHMFRTSFYGVVVCTWNLYCWKECILVCHPVFGGSWEVILTKLTNTYNHDSRFMHVVYYVYRWNVKQLLNT
jgi:hypothetical protein